MIDKPLIANVVASATVIVVGTLCVFYAEVCERLNSIEYLFEKFRWEMAKLHQEIQQWHLHVLSFLICLMHSVADLR